MSLVAATPLGLVRPRAILFDWDNTLVDSWATIHEALNVVMAAMEKPSWSLQETKERVRLSLRESFPIHFGARWEEAREIYLDAFRAIHLERLNSLPGRSELLRALFGEGFFLGVVSNKTGLLLRREADRIGCPGITVEIACLYTSCECASRRSRTQKLSNQVIIPCSLTPLTRKTVTGVLFLRTWLRNTS